MTTAHQARGEAATLIEATIAQATTGGQGIAVTYAHWAAAILANGLARCDEALAAARHAREDTFTLYISMWVLPELIEAAARTGNTHAAPAALEQLAETTQAGGTDFGLGLEVRRRALLGETAADELYREAIDRLGRTRLRPELARAHLLVCPTSSFVPPYPGAAANVTAQEVFLRGGFARAGGLAGPDVLYGLLRCSGRNVDGPGDQVLRG